MRGATVASVASAERYGFQSTLPVRGATTALATAAVAWLFQSTLPVRGATEGNYDDPL